MTRVQARARARVAAALGRRIEARGGAAYLGEPVTIAQHMLQTAALAVAAGAAEALVAAALLHDIGHLMADDACERDRLRRHDEIGGAYAARWFGPEVVQPLRLHVAAKRYLCAVEPAYRDLLSPASAHTLALQGGAMDAAQVRAFEAHRYADEAVTLRRWDEAAKVPGREVAPFAHYRPLIESLVALQPG